MDTDKDRAYNDALSFLKGNKVGVLATVSGESQVHASMVYYTADDTFNIFFQTLIDSRKFMALQAHPQVAFTVSGIDTPQTLQIEGMAMDISFDEDLSKKKHELNGVLNSNPWFDAPLTKLDPSEVVIVWIRPTWIRWANYAFEMDGTKHVLKEIPIKE